MVALMKDKKVCPATSRRILFLAGLSQNTLNLITIQMQESTRDKMQRKILRISMIATVVLIASVMWVNYDRNIRVGDKTLTFTDEPLPEVLQKLEDTYMVNIEILQDSDLSTCLLTGTFVDKTLEEMMGFLHSKYKLKVDRLAKREFEVSGEGC